MKRVLCSGHLIILLHNKLRCYANISLCRIFYIPVHFSSHMWHCIYFKHWSTNFTDISRLVTWFVTKNRAAPFQKVCIMCCEYPALSVRWEVMSEANESVPHTIAKLRPLPDDGISVFTTSLSTLPKCTLSPYLSWKIHCIHTCTYRYTYCKLMDRVSIYTMYMYL